MHGEPGKEDYISAISGNLKKRDEGSGSIRDQLFSRMDDAFWNEFVAGGIITAPVAHKGVLYLGSNDNHLYALDAKTGEVLWKFNIGGASSGYPFVYKDIVYIKSRNRNIYAVAAKDGSLVWKLRQNFEYFCYPIVNDGVLYVGGSRDQNLYAINPMDGSLIWKFRASGDVDMAPAVVNDTVFFCCGDKNLYALTTEGDLKWKFRATEGIDCSPAVADMKGDEAWSSNNVNTEKVRIRDGVICFGCWDGYVYALSLDGKELWRHRTNGPIIYSSPSIHKGVVYIGSFDKHLYAINLFDGSLKWKFEMDGYTASDPVIDNNIIYIGSLDNNLYAISLDGDLLWKFRTGGWVAAAAEVYDGVVYFGSYDSKMYAISVNDQKVLWKFQSLYTHRPEILMKAQMVLERLDTLSRRVLSLWEPETDAGGRELVFSDTVSVSPLYRSATPYASQILYKSEAPYTAAKKKDKWPF